MVAARYATGISRKQPPNPPTAVRIGSQMTALLKERPLVVVGSGPRDPRSARRRERHSPDRVLAVCDG